MKRNRVLGGVLAASAALVAAVALCVPASARQSGLEPVQALTPVPPASVVTANQGAMNCTCVPATSAPQAANPKDATVDELIARLTELKAKEAELTDLLNSKLHLQDRRLERLGKLGVSVDVKPAPVTSRPPTP